MKQVLGSKEYKYSNYNVLKFLCKMLKITGSGDYWYENPYNESLLYKLFHFLLYLFYHVAVTGEALEAIFYSYPKNMHNDAVSVASTHTVVLFRLHMLLYKKREIRKLIVDIVELCKEHEDNDLLLQQYKKIRTSVFWQNVTIYTCAFFFTYEGLRRYYVDGSNFVVMPTYWPKYEDNSTLAIVVKWGMVVFVMMFLGTLLTADSLAIVKLIIISNKCVTLARYFESLQKDFENDSVTINELREKCLGGIKMHQKLLSITKKFHSIYGVTMSVEVSQGFGVVILVLLNITLSSRLTLTILFTNVLFVIGIVCQLALYLWNAGEITYQASKLSTAMFHCGWHLRRANCRNGRALRQLLLMGCMQAQRPLVLKAFGVQDLSYSSFVSIVRTSYSIFAVFRNINT